MDISTSARLKAFIERVEHLEEERLAILEAIKETFSEAKANGFDVKIMRMVVRMRKMKREDRQEQEELLDLYMHALGMLSEKDVEAA